MVGSGWSLIESENYERAVAQCGGARCVDDAIAPIIYALHRQPLAFPETDVPGVYLARTKLRFNGPDVTLSHSVWFKADEIVRTVELLWVEYTNPDDIGGEDDWPF